MDQDTASEHPSPVSLQSSLHTATRTVHAQLNKTILTRFPQCLPPQASDPLVYHLGMLVFGQVFEDLEYAIDKVRTQPIHSEPAIRHKRMVEQQFTTSLARTVSLRHDQELLRKRLCRHGHEPDFIATTEERLQTQTQTHTQHINQHIQEKPYLALAYTWTMYLALFNGGRHLYGGLSRPGPDFWLEDDDASSTEIQALSFWRFDAANEADPDADQLKLSFKRNFDEASMLLTKAEADEVVLEAKSLFELCIRLIGLLDEVMAEVDRKAENPLATQDHPIQESGFAARLFYGLSTSVLRPAYSLVGWQWTRSLQTEVKAAE